MPGCRCAVFGCNNSRVATKAKGEDVIYHTFPKGKDLESKTVRDEWVRQCRRTGKWNPNTSTICSAHFCEDDYKRDLQNELLGLPIRRILKKTAVPTMNLPKPGNQSDSARKRRLEKRRIEKELNNLTTLSDEQPSTSQVEDVDASVDNSSAEYDYEVKYNELLKEHNKLKADFLRFRQSTRTKVRALNNRINYYKNKYAKLEKRKPP